jgi:hypothetical protein
MRQYSEGEIRFNLMALVRDRRAVAAEQLAAVTARAEQLQASCQSCSDPALVSDLKAACTPAPNPHCRPDAGCSDAPQPHIVCIDSCNFCRQTQDFNHLQPPVGGSLPSLTVFCVAAAGQFK